MSERRIQGVKVRETGNKQWQFDYQQGDMKALYNRGEWHSWRDEINWLQEHGERDNELTPGETVAMVEDLRSLAGAGAPFAMSADRAYEMAHRFRGENNRRFAQEHQQVIQEARGKK